MIIIMIMIMLFSYHPNQSLFRSFSGCERKATGRLMMSHSFSSSTAQGGGGSFKDRKL